MDIGKVIEIGDRPVVVPDLKPREPTRRDKPAEPVRRREKVPEKEDA